MLFYALTLAAILLVMANLSARKGGGFTAGFLICGTCFTFGGGFIFPVAMLFFLLIVAYAFSKLALRRRKYYPAISILSALVAFGIASAYSLMEMDRYAEMRGEFPCESMADRLPPPPSDARSPMLSDASLREMEDFESRVPSWSVRTARLRMLHDEKVKLFTHSPGFGVTRMSLVPTREGLRSGAGRDAIPQPAPFGNVRGYVDGDWQPQSATDDLRKWHREILLDFANPNGFGYVKDRRHVAGFQAHGFREAPEPTEKWKVQTLDLVSLLLHEQPVVYVSDELPRMDRLRHARTRPLNESEASALVKLRAGEDLVAESNASEMRMLGAIRCAKPCMACHGGQRGDLLGAFSYTLR